MVTLFRGDISGEIKNALLRSSLIACDTETSGLDWRTDRLHVCQIRAEAVGTVIVQFNDNVPVNLIEVLESAEAKKVFHHAPFDLAFLRSAWDLSVRNVACTKIASKLLSPNGSTKHSLQELLSRELDIHIEKGAIRISNWGATLSPGQLRYAADDVAYLIPLYELLSVKLENAGLSDLYDRCCSFLPTRSELDQFVDGDLFAY